MWQLLHESELPVDTLSRDVMRHVGAFRDYIRGRCTYRQIPYCWSDGGTLYFTFAGYLINKAIGLGTGKDFKAGQLTLRRLTEHFSRLPSKSPSICRFTSQCCRWTCNLESSFRLG